MSPRIQTSEPAYHAPVSQWQRERARGRLQPMETLPVSRWEARATYAVVVLSTVAVTIIAAVSR